MRLRPADYGSRGAYRLVDWRQHRPQLWAYGFTQRPTESGAEGACLWVPGGMIPGGVHQQVQSIVTGVGSILA